MTRSADNTHPTRTYERTNIDQEHKSRRQSRKKIQQLAEESVRSDQAVLQQLPAKDISQARHPTYSLVVDLDEARLHFVLPALVLKDCARKSITHRNASARRYKKNEARSNWA